MDGVWQNQKPVVIADVAAENRFRRHLEMIKGNGFARFAHFP